MPSALWVYYDRELRLAMRAANDERDPERLAVQLARLLQFERLIVLLDDEPRLDEVRRDVRWTMQRIVELSVLRATTPPSWISGE